MAPKKKSQTITVVLPSSPPLRSVDRIRLFDVPLSKALETNKLGSIIGSRTGVKSCDIDIDVPVDKLDSAILALDKKLRKLDCPKGTRLISGAWSKQIS